MVGLWQFLCSFDFFSLSLLEDKSCNGKDNCCTSSNPCAIGDGDCNEHTDCAEGLFCGDNNCAGSGLWGNGGFSYLDDCCTDEPPPPCNGKDNCCKPSNPCAKGDGDCNSDSDCAAGLFCGHNNCDGAGVFGFSDFTIYDDCCTDVPPPPPPPPPSIWNPGTWFGSPPPPPPPPSSSGSCLLGSTLILMQNYTSKPITEIKHGDMILDGNLNSVSVHSVITNYLYDRKMYDFKDGPVFTEDHLFYSNIETEELGKIVIIFSQFRSCYKLIFEFYLICTDNNKILIYSRSIPKPPLYSSAPNERMEN